VPILPPLTPPQPSAAAPARLVLQGIGKVYPTVVANDDIGLTVRAGEIRAILGENGAGKSTLMKIIYGVTRPSSGRMFWEGEEVQVESPAHARSLGIGMVFQHFSLFETLTVVENVALALPGKPALDALAQRIVEVSARYGLPVDPRRHIHALSVGERQRVEIVRCLLQDPRLLIMDEPTSVLTPQAVRKLFETLRRLADEGCSILYISHKLDEIRELCHTATVLRGGRVTGECIPAQETPASMARLMIGKELPRCEHDAPQAGGEVRLRLAGLSHASDDPFGTDLRDLHLDVHAGEIVGIAGVSGNGQQELLRVISGEEPLAERFPVQICGVEAGRLSPGRRRRLGMAFVPEERLGRGAVPTMSLADNALLTAAHNQGLVTAGFLRFERARLREALHRRLQRQVRWPGGRGQVAVGRQPAEVHRRPRDPAGAAPARVRAAHLGRGRRRRRLHPPADHRPAQPRLCGAGDLGGARRALRDLRPHRRDRQGPAVAGARRRRHLHRGHRRVDERAVAGRRGHGGRPARDGDPACLSSKPAPNPRG